MLDWHAHPDLPHVELKPDPAKLAARRAKMVRVAKDIWDNEVVVPPHDNSLVDLYLWSRQIILQRLPSTLRLHPSMWHSESGQKRPAMVGRIDHIDRGFCGIHATWLQTDGMVKASLNPPRKTFGWISGGAVRFGKPRSERWLVVGEGIESTLSVALAERCPGWAALSTYGIVGLQLPPEAARVLIAADNDREGQGLEAAHRAKRRWSAEGRRISIIVPPTPGIDWNDVLAGKAAAFIEGGLANV